MAQVREQLVEALEAQTATSEVLRIISSSPTEIQPVLEAVGENAARLCDANNAVIFRLEGAHQAVLSRRPFKPTRVSGNPASRTA
jgi:hypothetical protein